MKRIVAKNHETTVTKVTAELNDHLTKPNFYENCSYCSWKCVLTLFSVKTQCPCDL